MNRSPLPNADRPRRDFPGLGRVGAWVAVGAVLLVVAWLMPAYWKAVAPSVIERAGKGTTTVGQLGLELLKIERVGPAGLVAEAAKSLSDPQATNVAAGVASLAARKPELARWGSNERNLDMLLGTTLPQGGGSRPVLELLIPEPVRLKLLEHVKNSRLPGVQAIVWTRELTNTATFVPALQPGGQPYEATILFAALLYEGESFSASLAKEIKTLADTANESQSPAAWEAFCLDLLALGKRMNWGQVTELLRFTTNAKTLHGYARIAQTKPGLFPLAYTAALLTQNPEGVAQYLLKHEKQGGEFLSAALAQGQGGASLLLKSQLPIAPRSKGTLTIAAPLVQTAPKVALALKLAGIAGAILCFYIVWNSLSIVEAVEGISLLSPSLRLRRGGVAILLAVILVAAGEPYLFVRAGADMLQPTLNLPVLSNSPQPPGQTAKTGSKRMNIDLSTILSIALFGALQIVVYAVCLMKIQEIDRQSASAQLKLKLMENEENLFDSGLYLGIAGTATALVLQVLQLIEANLLAAYSSNLFGILCVAIVKIRHVRAYKRKLILRCQVESTPAAEGVATSARALA
jgi:hypothetical protein